MSSCTRPHSVRAPRLPRDRGAPVEQLRGERVAQRAQRIRQRAAEPGRGRAGRQALQAQQRGDAARPLGALRQRARQALQLAGTGAGSGRPHARSPARLPAAAFPSRLLARWEAHVPAAQPEPASRQARAPTAHSSGPNHKQGAPPAGRRRRMPSSAPRAGPGHAHLCAQLALGLDGHGRCDRQRAAGGHTPRVLRAGARVVQG